METQKYFENLRKEVDKVYEMAGEARAKGFDPVDEVEIPLAMSMAEKVVGLISTIYPQINNPQLVNRIKELEKEYGSLDPAVCLKIAEEVANTIAQSVANLNEILGAEVRARALSQLDAIAPAVAADGPGRTARSAAGPAWPGAASGSDRPERARR